MAKSGPVIIVEDDKDDQELMESAIRNAGLMNQILFFNDGEEAFEYLKGIREQPFMILCDVDMPKLNGIEFKRKIDMDPKLRERSIPFIFITTTVDKRAMTEAYMELTIQGFFQKSYSLDELSRTIQLIINYWRVCKHPHSEY